MLERYDLYTRSSLGQHFLVDDNIVGRILDLASLQPGEPVLEVGPGIGTLTVGLLDAGAAVVAIEYDTRLVPVLNDLAAEYPSLRLVYADAVSVETAELVTPAGPPRAFVSNLPYGVAATVILRFFQELPSLQTAVVMVQAEVADRIAASPGTKAYGAYTVKLALHARVSGRFPVPRSCFLPPPRVDSAVLRLDRTERSDEAALITWASRAADAAFSQRRKTVRNSLAAGLKVPVPDAAVMLEEAGIDGSLRAENLGVEEYLRLGTALADRGASDASD
jgi:16S rRNA (adenine1518-N6/adenine1519-N6)-dimethyltransferase